MLQFITHPSERFPIVDEVKMAIEGGCRWVQLRMKEASDNEVRRVAEELIPLCQEAGVILVLDDRVELTMELRVHGVHLGKEDMPVGEAREYLGPHAIIGATANTAADILALRGQDVDYVGLGRSATPRPSAGSRRCLALTDTVRSWRRSAARGSNCLLWP